MLRSKQRRNRAACAAGARRHRAHEYDRTTLGEIGCEPDVGRHVERLAGLAVQAGLRGLVCSPLEIVGLRQMLPAHVKLVTPGIRTGAKRRTTKSAPSPRVKPSRPAPIGSSSAADLRRSGAARGSGEYSGIPAVAPLACNPRPTPRFRICACSSQVGRSTEPTRRWRARSVSRAATCWRCWPKHVWPCQNPRCRSFCSRTVST